MKILLAATHLKLHGDGVSHYAFRLAKGLTERGHQVWLASSNEVPQDKLAEVQTSHVIIPLDQHQKTIFNALQSIRTLRRMAKEEKLDVIHAQHRWIGFLARFALRGLPTRLISTDHNILRGKQSLTYWGEHVISVSRAGQQHLVNYFGAPLEKITVIHNGVDIQPATGSEIEAVRQELRLNDRDMVLLNVARLDIQKGQSYLLEAMPAVMARRPNVKLVIAGDGPLEAELKRQAEQLKIAKNVIFTGVRPDITALLANAALFVLPSVWEGLPFAMLEAMALGVPVVATNVGGVGEVVAHQETGLLVRPASGEELANAIIWALTDQTVRERIAKAGQQKVRRRFGVESMLNQTEAVYKRVCR